MRFHQFVLVVCVSAVSARIPIPDPKPLPAPGTVGLCDITKDCDLDIDCAAGLVCADAHKDKLRELKLDERSANCPNVQSKPWNWELCFDPKILQPNGGGGGDPHFRTYDGTKYSFHGQCDLVMARSPAFGSGLGLEVHARTEIVSGWSLISNAAVQIGKDVLEVANDGSHFLNGKQSSLPLTLADKYKVNKVDDLLNGEIRDVFTIDLGKGETITISIFKKMIAINVGALLIGTEGMLGMNGVKGMVSRDHETVLSDPNEMGAQWQVRADEPKLFREARAPQYPAQCIMPETSARRLRESPALMKKAEEACASVELEMMQFCIDDVMLTGDSDLALAYGYAF